MIQIKHLSKVYDGAEGAAHALDDVSITIADGDIFGIIGMSGAGKSTLVRCINLLEHPTSGEIVVDGQNIVGLKGAALRAYRRRMAMIFQGFGLLSQKTVLQNVCFPFLAANGKVTDENRSHALERSPAASSSALPLRARLPAIPSTFSATRPRARLIRRVPTPCSRSCATSTARPA